MAAQPGREGRPDRSQRRGEDHPPADRARPRGAGRGRVRQGERRADRHRGAGARSGSRREAPRLRGRRLRRAPRDRVGDAPARAPDGRGRRLRRGPRPLRRPVASLRERGRLRHGGRGREGAVRPGVRALGLRAPPLRALRRTEEPGDARPRDPLLAGRPPPRRADEPPRLSGGRVPRGVPGEIAPRLPRRHPRPALPRPRRARRSWTSRTGG